VAETGRGSDLIATRTLLLALLCGGFGLGTVAAQNGTGRTDRDSLEAAFPVMPGAARVPFGPGERMVYKVKVGIFGVGEGQMAVEGIDTVRGSVTYRATFDVQGGLGPAKVDDHSTSWFDIRTLVSRCLIQDIHEVNYKSYRHYEMYPSERRWEREDNDEFGPLGSSLPLDDVSFIYFIRSMPLEVGKTYSLSRYFKEDGNPVVIQVLRRDEREVGAGKFKTIVVKPLIRTKGLFSQGGDAELHFTDDERRMLVYLKSNLPNFPGSLTLHLEEYEEGLPLNPQAREAALERHMGAPSPADTLPSR
jgi:hypothetical protein